MRNNGINRTILSASVCRKQRQSSHASSMKGRLFPFSLRLGTYQHNYEGTTGKMNSPENKKFDEILFIWEKIVWRVSNHLDEVEWNKPTSLNHLISLCSNSFERRKPLAISLSWMEYLLRLSSLISCGESCTWCSLDLFSHQLRSLLFAWTSLSTICTSIMWRQEKHEG